MTKNKRFSHEYEKDGNYIFDGEVGQSFYYGFCFMDSDKCSLDDDVNSLVDLLNKLNDENEQLYELIYFANTLIAFKTSESCQAEWEKRLKELKSE